MNVAVIGGGIFGSLAALKLAGEGHAVTLLERGPILLGGASHNNQNRLHLGFHYPRCDETARQCRRGFDRFLDELGPAVVGGFPNVYLIASHGSRTSPAEFLRFCARHRLPHRRVDVDALRPRVTGVELGVLTEEVVYDSALLRELIRGRLERSLAVVRTGVDVRAIHRLGHHRFELGLAGGERAAFDAVVNCAYGGANALTCQLGHAVEARKYEYTAVAIVELDWPTPTGLTVLDGEFLTVLPFGRSGRYLLYHVRHAVIAREEATLLDPRWLDARTAPFAHVDRAAWFARLTASAAEFVPDLAHARLAGVLEGPRVSLASREASDARPSLVTVHEPGYLAVLAGKIDHATWIADEVAAELDEVDRVADARAC